MKIGLALIVKGDNEEAKLLDRCLKNVSPFVDGIFVTRTQKPGEEKNEAVARVVKRYKGHLSDFEWIYDFSAARNFNFSQVPKDFDYILWTDADDIWRGLDKLRSTLEDHPHTDAFGFWYLYDWEEFKKPVVVHRKTMLIKNDGAAKWVGALHEDLEETRQLDVHLVEGIERLHITTSDRATANAKRNVEIATIELQAKPDDPRSHWNLANSHYGVQDYEGARLAFESFLQSSESDDEKYIAHARLSDVYRTMGDNESAVRQLQMAIGLKPNLPDAFFQMAYVYFNIGNWDKAEEYSLQGMVRRPQIHKMIVFNPRDYDYNPLMLLAKVYYQKNRPHDMLTCLEGCLKIYPDDKHLQDMVKEGKVEKDLFAKALKQVQKLQKITDPKKLRAAIDKLPEEIKSHPAVCVIRNKHFIKEESSGKDLVIYCGNTSHQWNPQLFKEKGFGGSEEAVIHLAREWAKLGWNVTVYNNCGHKAVTETVPVYSIDGEFPKYFLTDEKIEGRFKIKDGDVLVKQRHTLSAAITYRPFWEWNYRDKQDVTILWRWCKPLDAEINSSKIFVDLHDVMPPGEFTEKRLAKINKIFVKTEFHRSLFPNVPDEKIAVIPNGMELYTEETQKDPNLIINTSSPDRSMDVMPAIFKKIKQRFPRARMQWAYGWDVYKASFASDAKKLKWMRDTNAAMEEAGIENLGRLTQSEVAKLYQKAHVFAYPTEFAEIDCISVKKAQASGCVAITTDFGALKESNRFGLTVHSSKTKDTWAAPYQFHFGLEDEAAQDAFVELVVNELKNPSYPPQSALEAWTKTFTWPEIAKRWNALMQ